MGMRGFIASTESLFALTLFLSVLLIIATVAPFPTAKNEAYLRAVCMDLLSSFEKSGKLAALDKNGMKDVIKELPASLCVELELEGKQAEQMVVVKKPGCGKAGNDLVLAYRTFSDGNESKLALARAWTREGD